MSGAVAAHAAYNGAGTQGLAVTNKINDTGDVMSVFWNKNDTTRQLLHGSNFVEVPSQGTSGGASKTIISFDINNDVDCIGDIILEVTATIKGKTSPAQPFSKGGDDLLHAISRVEFVVGTQIWQTLEYDDILALYHSEVSEGGFANASFQLRGHYSGEDSDALRFSPEVGITTTTSKTEVFVANLPLKMLSKTLASELELFSEHTEDGYLMAAAPNQQVRINVSTNSPKDVDSGCESITVRLFSKNIVMCESERQQLSATRIAKRIKVTQNAIYRPEPLSDKTFTVVLDHFSIYASHLVLVTTIPFYRLDTAELLLNSSSFSGEVPFSLLKVTGSSMGLFSNYAENILGSDNKGYYIFPLASTAYSGSSVPLNRFDNIRLVVKTNGFTTFTGGHTMSITAVGCTTALYANGAASISMY
jgi:hypothetical protein